MNNLLAGFVWWQFGISMTAVILVVIAIIATIKLLKKGSKNKAEEMISEEQEEKIVTASIIGTRTGEQTKVFATYNFTIYSFLVVYESGRKEVIECENGKGRFNELIQYVDVNKGEEK